MSELYTSLTQLKMALNGGTMPPMTPLTDEAKKYLDPRASIGMGGIVEDKDKGLLCPVRGCGKFSHELTRHLNTEHRAIGGATAIRGLLSIAPNVSLVSTRRRVNGSEAAKRRGMHPRMQRGVLMTRGVLQKKARTARATAESISQLNLRNSCPAQLAKLLFDTAERIGRTPTPRDGHVPPHIEKCARKVFGSWNAAVLAAGLQVNRKSEWGHDDCIVALEEWVKQHGALPSSVEAISPKRTPMIPTPVTVLKAFGVETWDEAMSHASWLIGCDRYEKRPLRGESNPAAILTEDDIRPIRSEYKNGKSISQLARDYGVGRGAIHGVVTGRTWIHVDDQEKTA